jgi:hypothetical protein
MKRRRHAVRVVRNPVRGFLGGAFFGLGAVILLVVFGVATFSAWWPFLAIVVGCAALGVVSALYGPVRASVRSATRVAGGGRP